MTGKKYTVLWITVVIVVIAVLATVLVVEWLGGSDSKTGRFPEDSIEASVKLNAAGYAVSVEDNIRMLSSIAKEASEMYKIAFTGQITSYMTASDAETGELQAEIFYFENSADAKMLYDKMKEGWSFEKDEGELRIHDKTVYMGYRKALHALDK